MPLKHPVHIVCPDDVVWPELKDWDGRPLDDQILSDRSGGILHSWLLRTYYQLHIVGEKLTISNRLRRDAINLVSARDFLPRHRDLSSFVLVPQGDAHFSCLANFRIFQNGVRPIGEDGAVIWHWPQPGIIPRQPVRKKRMEQLCYKGRLLNLDKGFRSDAFISDLRALGVGFEIDAYTGLRGEHSWNDYAASDAVLAVRNLTHYDARKKPASKLVNAWFADLPAILGPEPAYREIGTPGQDYLEVCSPREALEAVAALKADLDLFCKIVENGRKRRESFTNTTLTKLWIDVLNGPIADAFEHWQRRRTLSRAAYALHGMLRESRSRADDRIKFTTGTRLLDPAPDGPGGTKC